MTTNEEVLRDIEANGRLSTEAENTLYKVIIREDAFSSEPTNMLLDDIFRSNLVMDLINRGYLTYTVINPGKAHEIAALATTQRGVCYGSLFADEIVRRQYR